MILKDEMILPGFFECLHRHPFPGKIPVYEKR
jgi:hypothetical protein